MAIEIKFRGYVNEVKTFDWGTSYSMSHNQVQKSPDGKWETVGRDYFSVVGPAGFAEGDLVDVAGTMKTKLYDKRDGTKGVALQVRAQSMVKAERSGPAQPVQAVWPDAKPIPDSTIPF